MSVEKFDGNIASLERKERQDDSKQKKYDLIIDSAKPMIKKADSEFDRFVVLYDGLKDEIRDLFDEMGLDYTDEDILNVISFLSENDLEEFENF